MTSMALRSLALVTMLVDHLGYALGPVLLGDTAYLGMRLVGRLAMPIFCFLIAEGFFHTKSVGRYAGRLLLFGLVSEIPYDLFCTNGGSYFDFTQQNVYFTLLLGLTAIWLFDFFAGRNLKPLSLLAVFACAAAAQLALTDYGMFGVALVFVCYCFRDNRNVRCVAIVVTCLLMGASRFLDPLNGSTWPIVIACAAVAAIPIYLYNGQPGRRGKGAQLAFYAFYPLHLLLITLII